MEAYFPYSNTLVQVSVHFVLWEQMTWAWTTANSSESQHLISSELKLGYGKPSLPTQGLRMEEYALEESCGQKASQKPIKILSKWFDDIVAKLYLILNISLSVGSHSSCQAKGHEAGAAGSDACSQHCQCQCSPDPDTYWSKRAGGAGAAALA